MRVILLCLLNILFPPLAVALSRGMSDAFVISMVLTILAFIPGVVYGFWIILQDNLD